jgi:ketosteroid isomerase-like protein
MPARDAGGEGSLTMNMRRMLLMAAATVPAAGCASRALPASREALLAEVRAAETGFADTMARRDAAAFAGYVAADAVFINGGSPLRGRAAVVAFWSRYFAGPTAPFSWKPEIVEVAGDGALGYSEGPVALPSGAVFARFYSTWRREADGRWRVVFDNGYDVCRPPAA